VEKATWRKFADIKKTYASVDRVGKCLVFNVGANKYRIIATWKWDRVYLRFVLTHKEYDQGNWRKDCQ
jgi:mRNA interferase HigB